MFKYSNTRIFIDHIKLYARHGVMKQEQEVGSEFDVSVSIDYDFSKAIENDNIDDTINYATVCDIVKREMAIPSKLLEHVAGRIAKAITTQYQQAQKVKVSIVKVNPPMGADCDGAGVEVELS